MESHIKFYLSLASFICFELLSLLPLLLAMVGLIGKTVAPEGDSLLHFISDQLTTFEFFSLGLLGAILLIMLQLLKSIRLTVN
jgi:hypothetical protein